MRNCNFKILGALPNSHRKIKPEIMRRMMTDSYINKIINSSENIKGLELLDKQFLVKFLAEVNEFFSDEMERFWSNSQNIQQLSIIGSKPFPGKMIVSISENVVMSNSMLDLL